MAKATTADTKPAKVDKPAKSKPVKADKPGLFQRFVDYIKGVRAEWNRTVWPTPLEVRNSSVVVVLALLFFVFFTLAIDTVSVRVLQLIQGLGQ